MRLHLLALGLLVLVSQSLAQEQLGDVTTMDGTVYESVTLTSIKPDKITFISKSGASSVSRNNLSPEDEARILAIQTSQKQASVDKANNKKEEEDFQEPWIPIINALSNDPQLHSSQMKLISGAQQVCRLMLLKKMVTQNQITEWCQMALKHEIEVGMPFPMVFVSWGSPDKINRSAYGDDQWIYNRGNYDSQYVYVRGYFVTNWSD